ncbi:hypothetical protein SAMN02745866_04296 [Alteromonadaceae bacterium Bs31]|nr:hypothetical protein SAMN02745866_04296 [Alteromonadaceae bacterium Bs31]
MIYSVIGLVVSILALLVAYLGYRIQSKKKSLCYKFKISPILTYSVRDEHRSKLKLVYDGEEVKFPKTIDVEIKNNGQIPVSSTDFYSPINVQLPNECKIMGSSVVGSSPENLDVAYTVLDNGLSFTSKLLNPGDWFSCRFTVDHEANISPKVHSRITGVSRIKLQQDAADQEPRVPSWVWLFAGTVLGAVVMFLIRLSEM